MDRQQIKVITTRSGRPLGIAMLDADGTYHATHRSRDASYYPARPVSFVLRNSPDLRSAHLAILRHERKLQGRARTAV